MNATQIQNDRGRLWALFSVVIVILGISWYPFTLDLPKRIVNSARRLDDGSWKLDRDSRVLARVPNGVEQLMSAGRFQVTLSARLGPSPQRGPGRLFSIARTPYDAGLMVGIDGSDLVVYLPCSAPAGGDAAWRVADVAGERLLLTLSLGGPSGRVMIGLNGIQHDMDNQCMHGALPTTAALSGPMSIGNVASGHRPFEGIIERLELAGESSRIDVLRDTQWDVPAAFWVWPERYDQPTQPQTEMLAALWHLLSFALLGYLAGAANRRRSTVEAFVGLVLLATFINAGKLLIAGRHAAAADLAVNVAGAAAGLHLWRRGAGRPATSPAKRSS